MVDAAIEWGHASAGLVELDFVDAVGTGQRLLLSACAGVRFEDARLVRLFRWSRGLGYLPGWWTETTGRHVGHCLVTRLPRLFAEMSSASH